VSMKLLMTGVIVSALSLSSCGGGGSGTKSANAGLSGNWQMSLQRDQTTSIKTEAGFLVQSGNSVTGSLLLAGATNCAGVGSVQGGVSGSNISITVSQVGQSINLTGAMNSDGSISGDYSIFASPCGSTQTGAWTAQQIQPLSGSFQGTFTSTTTSGLIFHFSGMVTQAPNTGATAANLSGTMTSTDAPCFTTASISGSISGTAVVFNLLSSEGVALGQLHGTASPDAGTITGLYDFLNSQAGPMNGCEDLGNVTVSLTP